MVRIVYATVMLVAVLTLAGAAFSAQIPGEQWVREHPFTIHTWDTYGLTTQAQIDFYRAANLNAVRTETWTLMLAKLNGVELHQFLYGTQPLNDAISSIEAISRNPNDRLAFYVIDEPQESQLDNAAAIVNWLRANRQNGLPYLNVWGSTTDTYIDNVLNTVPVEALMYDTYAAGGYQDNPVFNWSTHLGNLMRIRGKAMSRGIPYFSWMHAFKDLDGSHGGPMRYPSESELWMQVFSTLAAGYKGIGYFTYDTVPDSLQGGFHANAWLPDPPVKEQLYDYGAAINAQVKRLGGVLRYLNSQDVRFVPGAGHTSPTPYMQNWSSGAGGDPYITNVVVDAGQTGTDKDGLIGFFTEGSQRYFMLCNLYCHGHLTSAQAALNFTVTFSGVSQIYRLNRTTGLSETVPLSGGQLQTNLLGGQGDLYSYSPIDTAPTSGSITIKGGAAETYCPDVPLTISGADDHGVSQMRFSNDMCTWSDWETYSTSKASWHLDTETPTGSKTVHVQFMDTAGTTSEIYYDKITLREDGPSWTDGLDDYLGQLTKANTWMRWTGGHLSPPGSPMLVEPRYIYVRQDGGYGEGRCIYGPVYVRSRAYRAAFPGDKILFFRLRYPGQPGSLPYQREMCMRMTTLDEYESTYETSVTGPAITARFNWESWSVNAYFGSLPPIALLTDTWYDIRMKLLNSTTVEYAYKKSYDTTWNTVTGPIPVGFAFNYVNMENVHWYQEAMEPTPVLDDIYTANDLGTLSGTITFEGYTGQQKVNVEVQIREPGTTQPIRTEQLIVAPNGSYRIDNIAPGTYDFAFKAANWLREVSTSATIVWNSTTTRNITLLNGDCNGDNTVNTTDDNIVLGNTGLSGDP